MAEPTLLTSALSRVHAARRQLAKCQTLVARNRTITDPAALLPATEELLAAMRTLFDLLDFPTEECTWLQKPR